MVNFEVLKKILAAAEITPNDNVIEVGTGLAVLTETLAQSAKQITTIEYDSTLIPVLTEYLKKFPNVNLTHQDALKFELPTYDYKLVANIPYYITSPLLNHFLQPDLKGRPQRSRPKLIVLLVQKEVAEKICAREGDQSVLSLQVQIFGKPTIVSNVGKSSFFPAPKVDSAILKIEMFPEPLIPTESLPAFFRLIHATFSQKRKTLSNSLRTLALTREQALASLNQAGIAENQRPQALTIEEWKKLVEIIPSPTPLSS